MLTLSWNFDPSIWFKPVSRVSGMRAFTYCTAGQRTGADRADDTILSETSKRLQTWHNKRTFSVFFFLFFFSSGNYGISLGSNSWGKNSSVELKHTISKVAKLWLSSMQILERKPKICKYCRIGKQHRGTVLPILPPSKFKYFVFYSC